MPKEKFAAPDLSTLSEADLLMLSVRARQEITRRIDPLNEYTFKVKDTAPIVIVTLGDMHLGSLSTDYEAVQEMQQLILNTPGVYVVLLGDEIEGWVRKYSDATGKRNLPPDQQIALFQNFIDPLYKAKKVVGMVTEYFGHPGWIADESGMNAWQVMIGDRDIPLLANGATVTFQYKNRHQQRLAVYHNPGGRSQKDPVHGLRKNMAEDMGASAHLHESGVEASGERIYVASGTAKGSQDTIPRDNFGTRLGLQPPPPTDQGLLSRKRTRQEEAIRYPIMSLRREGMLLLAAMRLLDDLTRQGTSEELFERVRAADTEPYLVYQPSTAVKAGNEERIDKQKRKKEKEKAKKRFDNEPGDMWSASFEQQYEKPFRHLPYKMIDADLPFSVDMIANLRWTSASLHKTELEKYVADIAEDPYRFALWLGNLLDSKMGNLIRRKHYLDELCDLIATVGERNLGVLLSRTMRLDSWKRTVGGTQGGINTLPIAPATYIANQAQVRLLANQAQLSLRFPHGVSHTITPMDRLMNRGSTQKPLAGLISVYKELLGTRTSIVTGGHMSGSGWSQFYDRTNQFTDTPIMMAPGWWSEVDTLGKGNVIEGGSPGKAVIFAPHQKDMLLYPVGNETERNDFMNALTLFIGLEKAGMLDQVRSQPKGKRI